MLTQFSDIYGNCMADFFFSPKGKNSIIDYDTGDDTIDSGLNVWYRCMSARFELRSVVTAGNGSQIERHDNEVMPLSVFVIGLILRATCIDVGNGK